MSDNISIDLRNRMNRWAYIIKHNIDKIPSVRKPALDEIVSEMHEFTKEDKFTIIFYDENKIEPCPKCDYERGRVYRWLGRWYFMCYNCALGIPEPALIDWGKYGKLNEEDKKVKE